VVVAVSQLMGNGADAIERRLEVGQHARFVAPDGHAEGAVLLAGTRLGVDPALGEGARREGAQLWRVRAEALRDEVGALEEGPWTAAAADWREEIVPGQSRQPQRLRFGAQI